MSIHTVHWCIFLHPLNMLRDWVSVSWLHKRCDPLTSVSWAQNSTHLDHTGALDHVSASHPTQKAKAALQLSRLPNEPWLLVETMNGLEKNTGLITQAQEPCGNIEIDRNRETQSKELTQIDWNKATFRNIWCFFFNYHRMKNADSCMSQDNGTWYCIILFTYSKI